MDIIVNKSNLIKISNIDLKSQNKIYCHICKKTEEIMEIHYDPTEKVNLISINEYYVSCSICKTNWNAFLVAKCKKCLKTKSFYTRKNMLISRSICECGNIYFF